MSQTSLTSDITKILYGNVIDEMWKQRRLAQMPKGACPAVACASCGGSPYHCDCSKKYFSPSQEEIDNFILDKKIQRKKDLLLKKQELERQLEIVNKEYEE